MRVFQMNIVTDSNYYPSSQSHLMSNISKKKKSDPMCYNTVKRIRSKVRSHRKICTLTNKQQKNFSLENFNKREIEYNHHLGKIREFVRVVYRQTKRDRRVVVLALYSYNTRLCDVTRAGVEIAASIGTCSPAKSTQERV